MTYKDLAIIILDMDDEQKNSDVTVYNQEQDEYFKANGVGYCHDDVLDENHPFVVFPCD